MLGSFLTEQLSASEEELSSMYLVVLLWS